MSLRLAFAPLLLLPLLAAGADAPVARQLKIGIVQMAQAPTLAGNRDRIVAGIADAAQRGARVIVLPEAALMGTGSDDLAAVERAVAAIRAATRQHGRYVMFGATTHTPTQQKDVNWMLVLDPDGRDLLRYDKLYDQPRAPMPGVFAIDGVPCNAMICADRWLRGVEEVPIQQGAQVSFELSCNSWVEWVAPFGWYWYVPRAVRNNVWVIFANTGNEISRAPPYAGATVRHGHSAVIAPDGRLVTHADDDVACVLVADIDVAQATRAEAVARATHPALREFWSAGMRRQAGADLTAPALKPFRSPAVEITLAAAPITGDITTLKRKVQEARARHADVIVFPARAVRESELPRIQAAARENQITIVVGAEHHARTGTASRSAGSEALPLRSGARNSAFVFGPDGSLLTRYDELAARPPFAAGTDARAMWFSVKGVPAVVSVGRDALWSELSELAAAAGAQLHVHLDHDAATGDAARTRHQIWANLASFLTFSATVNVADAIIWDDLRGLDERRAPIGVQQPESGQVEVYSQYSANLVAHAKTPDDLLVVTRRVNATNDYHSRTIARKNPQMDPWFRLGAASLQPTSLPAAREFR